MASLIADGYHLRPQEIQTFYKVKGPDKTLLVSDVTSLGGMPPGNYELFGQEVIMTTEGKITMPSEDVLAGASYLITTGIENMMRFTQCSLAEAIHMASRNPARLLGLDDRGEIREGKRADLVMFILDDGRIRILKTWVAGTEVFSKHELL
jgi:N-acetylglucosamine-6-phosphate deacetylase